MEWIQALKEAVSGHRGSEPVLVEARSAYRIPIHLPATVQLPGGELVVGIVLNFSAKGLKLSLPRGVGRKQTILVTLKGRQRIRHQECPVMKVEGRVVWSRRETDHFELGVESVRLHDTQFNHLVDFFREELRLNKESLTQQRRQGRRVPSQVPVFWQADNGEKVSGLTLDLSGVGLRFRTSRANKHRAVRLFIGFQDGEPEMETTGAVKRWAPVPRSSQFEVVVTLPSLAKAEQERLVAWIQRVERGEVPATWTFSEDVEAEEAAKVLDEVEVEVVEADALPPTPASD